MARFQALTNHVLDAELELLRDRLGLEASQKAELLREIAALASWVVRQAEQGRAIEARKGATVEKLVHPTLERLAGRHPFRFDVTWELNDAEVERLSQVLTRPFSPTPGLQKTLANLANPQRKPPALHWKRPTR